jgi:hypothetical protein
MFSEPDWSTIDEIVKAFWIVTERGFVAVLDGVLLSVTLTVKSVVPAESGVPLITPVLESRVAQEGRAPEETSQAYGVVPPVASRVWLYN